MLPSLVDLQKFHPGFGVPYSTTPCLLHWKAYTECFVHTLVLLNTDTDEAYFDYAQNEITKKNARVLV